MVLLKCIKLLFHFLSKAIIIKVDLKCQDLLEKEVSKSKSVELVINLDTRTIILGLSNKDYKLDFISVYHLIDIKYPSW